MFRNQLDAFITLALAGLAFASAIIAAVYRWGKPHV